MSNENDLDKLSSLSAAIPSVSPSILRAIGALIGGPASYLAAWMRRPTQAIDDKTDARQEITRAVARAAGELAAADPEIVRNAVNAWLPKELKRQENIESVVSKALDYIPQNSEFSSQETGEAEVNEDWLSSFEAFASQASSERLREFLAKVLAGELVNPGTYSKNALRFMFELGNKEAVIIEKHFRNIALERLFYADRPADLTPILELEGLGLITGASGTLNYMATLNGVAKPISLSEGSLILIMIPTVSDDVHKISIPCYPLTSLGREIAKLFVERDSSEPLMVVGEGFAPYCSSCQLIDSRSTGPLLLKDFKGGGSAG